MIIIMSHYERLLLAGMTCTCPCCSRREEEVKFCALLSMFSKL